MTVKYSEYGRVSYQEGYKSVLCVELQVSLNPATSKAIGCEGDVVRWGTETPCEENDDDADDTPIHYVCFHGNKAG